MKRNSNNTNNSHLLSTSCVLGSAGSYVYCLIATMQSTLLSTVEAMLRVRQLLSKASLSHTSLLLSLSVFALGAKVTGKSFFALSLLFQLFTESMA